MIIARTLHLCGDLPLCGFYRKDLILLLSSVWIFKNHNFEKRWLHLLEFQNRKPMRNVHGNSVKNISLSQKWSWQVPLENKYSQKSRLKIGKLEDEHSLWQMKSGTGSAAPAVSWVCRQPHLRAPAPSDRSRRCTRKPPPLSLVLVPAYRSTVTVCRHERYTGISLRASRIN